MLDFICMGSTTCKGWEQAKHSKLKYVSPTGIELAILCYLAGPLVRLAIGTVDNLCFNFLQYSEVTANAWSVSSLIFKFSLVVLPSVWVVLYKRKLLKTESYMPQMNNLYSHLRGLFKKFCYALNIT